MSSPPVAVLISAWRAGEPLPPCKQLQPPRNWNAEFIPQERSLQTNAQIHPPHVTSPSHPNLDLPGLPWITLDFAAIAAQIWSDPVGLSAIRCD